MPLTVLRRPDSAALASLRVEGGEHPRPLGWLATTALAMGGSNQSLFLIGALMRETDMRMLKEDLEQGVRLAKSLGIDVSDIEIPY